MHIPTGDELREVRHSRGLTQAELAEKARVSQPLIARIESGDVDPTLSSLHDIVTALNNSESRLEEDQIEIAVPSALKIARNNTGYTQRQLAEAADVSQPLISRIERGDVNPRASTLRSLFDQVDPVSTTDTEKTSTTTQDEKSVLTQIKAEFDELKISDIRGDENNKSSESNTECVSCGTDLSVYPDPNFCPECGKELRSPTS